MDDLQISPRDVKHRLDRGDNFLLVDVREPWENQHCSIHGSTLVPLRTIADNLALFEGATEVVLYCHHGIRSLNAAVLLRQQGVVGVRSMTGGIERWALDIDPGVPRY